MTDLLIRGATVIDGTGAPGVRASVVVDRGRIASIEADGAVATADRVLDAGGLVLAPGYIDMHSHADFTLPSYPAAINSLAQGVTTEVIGNCGYSPAPLAADPALAAEQRAECHGLGPDLDWAWRSFGEYLARLDAARPAVNVIPLVGHGMLRLAVVGAEERAATPAELDGMRTAAAAALADGAWGMSTGLVYPPGAYAVTDEIVAVGEALSPVGGLYASHIRNENDDLAEALHEAIEIGRRLGVPVEVSHLKAAGRQNHGRAAEALAILDAARAAGGRVHHDAYPYAAGSTLLTQLLPPWVHDGGNEAIIARLGSAEVRARIAADVASGLPGWPNYIVATGGWDGILIAAVVDPSLRWLEGKTVARAAAERDMDPLTLALDTMAADRGGDDDDRVADGRGRRGRDHRGPVDLDRVGPAGRHDPRRPRPSARLRHVRAGARPLRARAGGAGPVERDPPDDRPAGGRPGADRPRPDRAGRRRRPRPVRPDDRRRRVDLRGPDAGRDRCGGGACSAGQFAVDGGRPVRPSLGRVLRPEVSGPRRPPRSG